jgi:hypothetical protein
MVGEGVVAVRVLLVLAVFALLYGCGQPNTPVHKQENKHGVEQAAQKPVTKIRAVTEPVAKPMLSGQEQAALAEAYCRIVTYASKRDMSQQEVRAFIDHTAEQSVKEMEDAPSLSGGAAGNKVLDDLAVPRYPQCAAGGE